MLGADFIDDAGEIGVFGSAVADQPVPEIGIGPLEHVRECGARGAIGVFVARRQPPAEEAVELARAAAAAPAQAIDIEDFRHCEMFPLSRLRERAGVRAIASKRFASVPSPSPLPQAGEGKTCDGNDSRQLPWRSTMSFLTSAIAFAGLSPFGH